MNRNPYEPPPCAAPAHFPYHHRTVAQVDADHARDRERNRIWRAARKSCNQSDMP